MQIPCTAATYTGTTKHWFINDGWFGDPWVHLGDRVHNMPVDACAEEEEPPDCSETPEECEIYNPDPNSPIIVDTAGDGSRLTSAADGVWFDLDADGNKELVAWTLFNSDDGWLAMDRNGNGRIDNGSELFGNHTPAYADQAKPSAAHGFVALAFLENPAYGRSNGDTVIDHNDAPYSRLFVWIDRNHNGESESGELRPVSEVGLAALETDFKESKLRDQHGNEYRQRAVGWWTKNDQPGKVAARYLYDVWLKAVRN